MAKSKKTTAAKRPTPKRKAEPVKYEEEDSDEAAPVSPAAEPVDSSEEEDEQPSLPTTKGKGKRGSKKGNKKDSDVKKQPSKSMSKTSSSASKSNKKQKTDSDSEEGEEDAKEPNIPPAKAGKSRKSSTQNSTSAKKAKVEVESAEADDSKEYEVEKILDVQFQKDEKKLFLIKWKGYSKEKATWEPESNLDCHEMVETFMAKVHDLKDRIPRELRLQRKQTQRYYDSNRNQGVRSSRRNAKKPRTTYHGQED